MSVSVSGGRRTSTNNICTSSRLSDWYLEHVKVQIIQVHTDHHNSNKLLYHWLYPIEITHSDTPNPNKTSFLTNILLLLTLYKQFNLVINSNVCCKNEKTTVDDNIFTFDTYLTGIRKYIHILLQQEALLLQRLQRADRAQYIYL